MKKIFLLLLIVSAFACRDRNKRFELKNEKANFSISFPNEPKKTEDLQFSPYGELIWTIYKCIPAGEDRNNSYIMRYCELSDSLANSNSLRLIKNLTRLSQIKHYKEFKSSQRILVKQIKKYQGRQYEYSDEVLEIYCISRCFVVKNRLYVLDVRCDIEEKYNDQTSKFFDSFKLLLIEENKNPEKVIKYPEKDFELDFPGKTKVLKVATDMGEYEKLGTVLEAFEIPSEDRDDPDLKNIFYGINYIQLPPNINSDSVDLVKKLILKTVKSKGTIIRKKEIKFTNCWGLESHIKMRGVPAVIHEKAFAINDKLYLIGVISYQGKENNKEANDFFNSFRLKRQD